MEEMFLSDITSKDEIMDIPIIEDHVSDKDVLYAFNSQFPGLEKLGELLEQKDEKEAKRLIIEHFEKREYPIYFFDYRQTPLKKIDTETFPYFFQSALGLDGNLKEFMMYTANKLLEKIYVLPGKGRGEVFLGYNYEDMPHFNCHTDQGKKHRHNVDMFVRGQFFESLAVAYHETGNSKYIECFQEILDVFIKTYPLEIEDTSPSANRFMSTEDRDVMSAGWLSLVLSSLFYTRLPYEIPTEQAFKIIKKIWFIGMQFHRFDNDGYRPYNHHYFERGLVPYILSVLYPEIPAFRNMRERGLQVSRRHILEDFNEQGGYNEHSICYWAGAALGEMTSKALILSRKNDNDFLTKETSLRIKHTFDLLATIAPPTIRYPGLGDHDGPLVDTILQLGVASAGNIYCQNVLRRRNGDNECRYLPPLDYSNDITGFTVSRSDYDRTANYLMLSTKIDCGYTGHNHMDMLSAFIVINGEEIIGEPYVARLGHRMRMKSVHRGYAYNMDAHNSVLCYSRPIAPGEMYANKFGVYRPDSPVEEARSTSAGFYVKASHCGYTCCKHIRQVWFSRKAGMLFLDIVERGNRLPQAHIQRWHLTKDATIRKIHGNIYLVQKKKAKALFIWDTEDINIWKNTILCPEIFESDDELFPIVDANFRSHNDDINSVIKTIILDISDLDDEEICRIPKINIPNPEGKNYQDVFTEISNIKDSLYF